MGQVLSLEGIKRKSNALIEGKKYRGQSNDDSDSLMVKSGFREPYFPSIFKNNFNNATDKTEY